MNKYLQLYSSKGLEKFKIPISSKAAYKGTLMEEFYLSLDFNLVNPFPFEKGDFVNFDGLKFELLTIQKPSFNAQKLCYQYNFRLDWEISQWKNKICFYTRQEGFEAAWKLTGFIQQFAEIINDNLEAIGFGNYKVVLDPLLINEAKFLTFSSVSIWDALTYIAEEWNAEWWVEGYDIKIGKCNYGTAIDFEIGDLITNITPESTSKEENFTRIYVFGSTRNLTKDYRPDDEQAVIEGVVERRLKLPTSTNGYIDLYENMSQQDIVEGILIFDNIYPREKSTIKSVETVDVKEQVDNGDGTSSEVIHTAYRFTIDGFEFKKEYLLDRENPFVHFETGNLAGLDFEVKWNPLGKQPGEEGEQLFEIIINETYGAKLPNEYLFPSVGDSFVLYNINIKIVNEQLIGQAEEELLQAGKDWFSDSVKDKNNYTCQTNKVRCAGFTRNDKGDLVHEKSMEIDLGVGQSINLISDAYFYNSRNSANNRLSRVYSFEKKIWNKFDATYVVGEQPKYSRLRVLQNQIDEIQLKGVQAGSNFTVTGGRTPSGASFYIIKRLDATQPSEQNVYSALRSRDEFLSRKEKDTALEEITFAKGHRSLNAIIEKLAQTYDLEVSHVAEIFRTIVLDYISSENFIPGITGTGMKLYKALNGDWNIELDNITVRKTMQIFELIISKIRSVNGAIAITQANGKVTSVEDTGTHYKLSFDTEQETFKVGDFVRCQQFKFPHIKHYWVRVDALSGKDILLLKSDFSVYLPEVGDDIIQMGSDSDTSRQSVIYLSADSEGRPSIDVLNGVNSPSFEGKLKTRNGCLDGITDSDFPQDSQPSGYGFYGSNVFLKGVFVLRNGKTVDDEVENLTSSISNVEKLAQDASEDAIRAIQLLADISSDNKLTPNEKSIALREWESIQMEHSLYLSQAQFYGVDYSIYESCFVNLGSYIHPLLQSLTTTSDIEGNAFRNVFNSYYDARSRLLNAFTLKVKELTDASNDDIDLIRTEMNTNFSVLQGRIAMGIQKSLSISEGSLETLRILYEQAVAVANQKNANLKKLQEDYKKVIEDSYADGIITNSEEKAIEAAKLAVDTAQQEANLANADAEKAAQDYYLAQDGVIKDFVDTQIEVVSGQITLGVQESKDYAQNLFDSLESPSVGGVNLILESDVHVSNAYTNIVSYKLSEDIIPDEDYTIAIYGYCASSKFAIYMGNGEFLCYLDEESKGIYVGHFKGPEIKDSSDIRNSIDVYHYPSAPLSPSEIFKVKLERGTVRTDWTLAPLDLKENYENFTNVAKQELDSQIKILSKQISLKVSQSDFNALGLRVSNAESQIQLNSDAINLRVTKSEFESLSIGGENLVLDSSMQLPYEGTTNNISHSLVQGKFGNCTRFTGTGTVSYGKFFEFSQLPLGVELVISVKVRTLTPSGKWSIGFQSLNGSNGSHLISESNFDIKDDLGDGWFLFARKFIVNSYSGRFGVNSLNGGVYMCHLQVEVGNKHTSWKPASADNDSLSRILALASMGNLLFKDPTFKEGLNGIKPYATSNSSSINIVRYHSEGLPNDSKWGVRINGSLSVSPDFGGFSLETLTAANKIFICRLFASFPKGFKLNFHTNVAGDNYVGKWMTSNKGTGAFEEYVFYLKCGGTGSFSTSFYFSIASDEGYDSSISPYIALAYATVFDVSGYEKYTTYSEFTTEIEQLATSISLKADSSVVDALGNRVTDAESRISLTSKQITLISSRFNDDGSLRNTAGLVTTADANTMFAFDAEGNIVSFIEQTPSSIKIKAQHISLEGIVTANNYFKILEDGSMEAAKGTLGTGDKKLIVDGNGIYKGDISSWTFNNQEKMLISPQAIRINSIDSASLSSYARVSLGQQANPNSSYAFGTVAYIKKYDVSSSYEKAMQPAMQVDSVTAEGVGIALRTNGSVVASGGIYDIGEVVQTDSSMVGANYLNPFSGSVFIVKNSTQNKPLQLPNFSLVQYALGLKSEGFIYRMRLISVLGNSTIYLYPATDNIPLYNGNSRVTSYISISANSEYEFTLVFDGTQRYWYFIKLK